MFEIRPVQPSDRAVWMQLDPHLSDRAFDRKVRDRMGYLLFADGVPAGLDSLAPQNGTAADTDPAMATPRLAARIQRCKTLPMVRPSPPVGKRRTATPAGARAEHTAPAARPLAFEIGGWWAVMDSNHRPAD